MHPSSTVSSCNLPGGREADSPSSPGNQGRFRLPARYDDDGDDDNDNDDDDDDDNDDDQDGQLQRPAQAARERAEAGGEEEKQNQPGARPGPGAAPGDASPGEGSIEQRRLSEDFTITEKAPTRAFSWLKAITSAAPRP